MSAQTARPKSVAQRRRPGAGRMAVAVPALDYPLIAVVVTLLALGLVEVYSASFLTAGTYYFVSQIGWIAVGLIVLIFMASVNYRLWLKMAVPIMAVTLVLLVAVLLFGQDLYGARRTLFGGRVQPSEFAKLSVVIYVAAWVASKKKHLGDVRAGLIPFAIVMGVVGGLVVLERSLSVTIVILVTGVTIFFVGGGDIKQLLITALIAAAVLLFLTYEYGYGAKRIQEWWTAITEPDKAPYSVQQVGEIIRRGGGIGTRPENWLQKTRLPLLWSDYLFANLAADFKFPGTVLVVALFAAFGYRGLSVALNAPDQFGSLTAIGITTWILAQAVIHMGVSVALIPATGLPLPLMSYGGSSILACMIGVGILLSISRASPEKRAPYESFAFGWGNRRPRVSDSGHSHRAAEPARSAGLLQQSVSRAVPTARRRGRKSPLRKKIIRWLQRQRW